MARKVKVGGELKGKARLRSEIVEAIHGVDKIGAVGDAELEKNHFADAGPQRASESG